MPKSTLSIPSSGWVSLMFRGDARRQLEPLDVTPRTRYLELHRSAEDQRPRWLPRAGCRFRSRGGRRRRCRAQVDEPREHGRRLALYRAPDRRHANPACRARSRWTLARALWTRTEAAAEQAPTARVRRRRGDTRQVRPQRGGSHPGVSGRREGRGRPRRDLAQPVPAAALVPGGRRRGENALAAGRSTADRRGLDQARRDLRRRPLDGARSMVTESMFRWTGWSLCARRLGKHIGTRI